MKISTFLAIKAVISLIIGIGFLLMPVAVMSSYGITLDTVGTIMSRYFGAAILGLGLICWLYRNADFKTLEGITLSLFVADTLGFIIALLAQFTGLLNALGWVNVIIWLCLAFGLGYFRFIRSATAEATVFKK